MKKLFIICLLLLGMGQVALAQKSKVREAKVQLIKERLKMTPQQDEKFWPVYNRYQGELRVLRRYYADQFKKDRSNPRDKAEAIEYVSNNLEYQQKVVEIKKKYANQFKKVISAQQLANFYQAEKDFKRLLLEKLRSDKGGF